MAENQESAPNIIESLALVTDAMQTIFPEGKMICVYELNDEDYKKIQSNFRKIAKVVIKHQSKTIIVRLTHV